MQNLDSKQNRFILISLVICVLFSIAIVKAFQYIPAKTVEFAVSESTVDVEVKKETEVEEASEDEFEEANSESEEYEIIPFETEKTKKAIEKLESLGNKNIDGAVETEKEELSFYEIGLQKSREAFRKKDLEVALSEYTKTIEHANNSEEKAICYEELAKIYAMKKDFLSAQTYAQLAFNEKPNSDREVLLARIYYKTGQKDRASIRINNVLNRDFSSEY